ncbi:MAG: ATP-dependent DNA helicase RecG [Caulobacterales bacterium]|nr:ATP-dependent DNA helicase RecG [Caulobacterales bacterium]
MSRPQRPEILHPLFTGVDTLAGIGPKIAQAVDRVAGPTLRDLLLHAPSGVVDRSARPAVADAPDGAIATFEVEIEKHMPPNNPRRPYRVRARDDSAFLTLAWFHARGDYLRRIAPEGATRIVSGKVERFSGEIQILHPDYVVAPNEPIPAFEPVYPLTQGLTLKTLRKAVDGALALLPELPDWLDPHLKARERWDGWADAVRALHAPQSAEDLDAHAPARARLAYDELLADQLALHLMRERRRREPGRRREGDGRLVRAVLDAAPFPPTGAQKRAFDDIAADLASDKRMARLLQGDVGAGKTFVAALAVARAAEAGVQSCLMAPTEILARQHARTLAPMLEAAGLRVTALTSRDKGVPRRTLLADIASGEAHVVCGTHALFQDDVAFADLGLVVIDEQHRFGVSDRLKLATKADRPDLLVMTATPIPRTLTLAAFGDLDVSRLDEKPPGRSPVDTRVVSSDRLAEVMEGVGRAIEKGDRVYWVCPLVEETDTSDLAAAEERWRGLATMFGEARVGLLHGRLKPAEKEARAEAFKKGETSVLVATTVVEVGVDAPDATVMIIEHAERFGLAQLHQLRGRVGRGAKKSTCLLVYKAPLTDTAKARLDVMRRTEDGFLIAEEDWRLRGPGDLLGTRQSGLARFRLADLAAHGELLQVAADDARAFAERDPLLESERGQALRVLLYLFDRERAVALLRAG